MSPQEVIEKNGVFAVVKGEYEKGVLRAVEKGGVIEAELMAEATLMTDDGALLL